MCQHDMITVQKVYLVASMNVYNKKIIKRCLINVNWDSINVILAETYIWLINKGVFKHLHIYILYIYYCHFWFILGLS